MHCRSAAGCDQARFTSASGVPGRAASESRTGTLVRPTATSSIPSMTYCAKGSNASVIFGKNVTSAAPGSAQGLYLIVSDIEAARSELVGRGVAISEAFHAGGDVHVGPDEPYLFGRVRLSGPDPERGSYRSYASFSDPDGNGWLLQEITARLPGRIDGTGTSFTSSADLAAAFRRAAAAHGEYEKRNGGKHDENWPDWYADYIVNEQHGQQQAA